MTPTNDTTLTDPGERIFTKTCEKCERPALTFDEDDRALCPRHATIFIMVPRIEPAQDDDW